jgi:20S proteasome subunit beta 4
MSDSLIGIVGDGYVLLAADSANARSVMMLTHNEDKIMKLDNTKLLAGSGPTGDRVQFCDYIQKNIALYELRTGTPLSTHAAANYTRKQLAEALRSNPYQVNLLLGGYDKTEGPALHFIDYMASAQKLDFATQGYAGYFLLGLLDKYYKKNMTLEEGLNLINLCIEQLKTRFVLNQVSFVIKMIDKDGIKILKSPPPSEKEKSESNSKMEAEN